MLGQPIVRYESTLERYYVCHRIAHYGGRLERVGPQTEAAEPLEEPVSKT
jgi:hypothetical protein